jgi:hypothetical protein
VSQIHTAAGPAVMRLLRDAVVNLVHQAEFPRAAARLRYYSRHPEEALRLLSPPFPRIHKLWGQRG